MSRQTSQDSDVQSGEWVILLMSNHNHQWPDQSRGGWRQARPLLLAPLHDRNSVWGCGSVHSNRVLFALQVDKMVFKDLRISFSFSGSIRNRKVQSMGPERVPGGGYTSIENLIVMKIVSIKLQRYNSNLFLFWNYLSINIHISNRRINFNLVCLFWPLLW